jgi:ribonuclease HI
VPLPQFYGGLHLDDVEGHWAWVGTDGSTFSGHIAHLSGKERVVATLEELVSALGVDATAGIGVHIVADSHSVACLRGKRQGHRTANWIRPSDASEVVLHEVGFDAVLHQLYLDARTKATWMSWDERLSDTTIRATFTGEPGHSVVIAADGSFDAATNTGVWCWYESATNNRVGLCSGYSTSYTELAAIYDALCHVGVGVHVTVLSDCQSVVRALGFSDDGENIGATGRGARDPNEEALRKDTRALIALTGARLSWVRGHDGHALQTQADVMARSALRAYGRYNAVAA